MVRRFAGLLVALFVCPSVVFAQASIAGIVKDTSGAILPGVTVEASSPALIEKVRSVVTDATGQYRIIDLRPGTYTVTFMLTGFSTVKREGLELTGSFTATVDTELRVGALQETVTVTGETPVVDIQSATRQRVVSAEVINTIPTNRTHYDMVVLIPGVTASTQDVGGAGGNQQGTTVAIHGSHGDDMRVAQNGVSLGTMVTAGGKSATTYNMGAVQEVTVDYAAVSAEMAQGGVRINLIPKDGGNTFVGSGTVAFANHAMQGNNYTQELKDRGLATPGSIERNWSVDGGVGGPIMRDKVWFFGAYQNNGAWNRIAGIFYNLNAGNPTAWAYSPDTSRPVVNYDSWGDAQTRLTWQATARNKFGLTVDRSFQCQCPSNAAATTSPEAGHRKTYPNLQNTHLDWSSPVTNRLLIEAHAVHRRENFYTNPPPGVPADMISVTDQLNGLTYRVRATNAQSEAWFLYYRASVSYVTGAHEFKVGFNDGYTPLLSGTSASSPISFRVNSVTGVPVPNQITLQATPYQITSVFSNTDGGLFAQDKWTVHRLTLGYGVRYDFLTTTFPQQTLGPGILVPTRNLTLPETPGVSWKDLTPKLGVSYDLFGNGKTALKGSANKYVSAQGLSGPFGSALSPASLLILSTTRTWTDRNNNFVPDCNLTNPAAQTVTGGDICGAMANTNFGSSVPGSSYNPSTITGWGKRPYSWEFSAGVQQEVAPRVSVEVSYFRRLFGNFTATDNLAVNTSDYNTFSITAPADARLPGGGGYTVAGLYDLNPAKFGVPANNYVTFADAYGSQTEHWNGVDASVTARMRNGLLLQGGTSTGQASTNSCEIRAALPESALLNPYCAQTLPVLTQIKALASYTVPKIDVQFSGVFQSIPGPAVVGNFVATSAVVQPSLGRPLSGGAANVTVNLVNPGDIMGDRLNQLDVRLGKILKFGRTRSTVNLDFYNILNASTVLTENASYATFRQPTTILNARFMKVGMRFDF